MLEIKNICKSYRENPLQQVQTLKNVSLQLAQGEIVGLFGENGAGKTTLLKAILGYLPFQGEILLDGRRIDKGNIARLSFATCEHSFFPNLSPGQHADFYRMHFGSFRSERFHALMEFFSLPMDKRLKAYSTGQKNQFEVILSLCQGADYILMDEPFAGNDVFNREDFYKVLLGILEPSETILLSTHLIQEVEHFIGRAVLLHQGTILGDTTVLALEEQGMSLMDYVRETYQYQGNRVSRALTMSKL